MTGSGNHGPTFSEQQQRNPGSTVGRGEPSSSGMMGAVKEKAQNLASSASEMAGQVKDTAREWASSVAGGARQAWESTREGTREFAHRVGDRAEEAWEGTGNLIRRHPVASLLVALGFGFVLGQALALGTRRRW